MILKSSSSMNWEIPANNLKGELFMANMEYCRFENTLADLKDCNEHMDDAVLASEAKARDQLIKLCADIAIDAGEVEYPE